MTNLFLGPFLLTILSLVLYKNQQHYAECLLLFSCLAFASALSCYILKKNRLAYGAVALAISLLISSAFLRYKDDFRQLQQLAVPQDQYINISGVLTDYPQYKIRENKTVLMLKTESMTYLKIVNRSRILIRLVVNGDLKNLDRGATLDVSCRLSQPAPLSNFSTTGPNDSSLVRGIHFFAHCKSVKLISQKRPAHLFWRIIGHCRRRIQRVIENRYLNHDRDGSPYLHRNGVFLQAILTGNRENLTAAQKESLLGSGMYHLFAISGAHIGIMAILLLLFFKALALPQRSRLCLVALILLFFLALSGFKIPAQRAVIMALLIFLARGLYLDIHIFNILSLSGLIILSMNPSQFLDPGYALTFVLTAGIILGRTLILPLLRKWPRAIGELLSVNISASLLSIPLSLYFFKRYSFSGLFAGLILIPLTAVIIGLGLILIPLALVSLKLAGLLLSLAHLLLNIFYLLVHLFSDTVRLTIHRPSPPFLLLVIMALLFLFSISEKPCLSIRLTAAAGLVAAFLIILIPGKPYDPAELEVFFLDVGQGDCQVIVFPGGDAMLIDGGGSAFSDYEVGKKQVLPFLLQKRIRIRWVSCSHFHPDHVGGLLEIIPIIKPEAILIGSAPDRSPYYRQLKIIASACSRIVKISSGFQIKHRDCRITCLYPPKFITSSSTHNNHSLVLRAQNRYHSFLFTGDIEAEAEEFLVETRCPDLASTIIKVPHHGSKTSSTAPFISCVSAKFAVVSCAKRNRFQFPDQTVVSNYKMQFSQVLTTARYGGIRIQAVPGSLPRINVSR